MSAHPIRDRPLDLPRPIAWALSSGAALGAMHAGMAKALVEIGVGADVLVGSSSGAMNAAFLGRGVDADNVARMESLWSSLRFVDAFGRSSVLAPLRVLAGRSHLVSGRTYAANLRNYLPSTHEELAVPVRIVATELADGRAEVLTEGDLPLNVLASAAIPGVFPAVDVGGKLLVDGGVSAYVPIDEAVRTGAKTVIVLDAGGLCRFAGCGDTVLDWLIFMFVQLFLQQTREALEDVPEDLTILYLPSHCSGPGALSSFEARPTDFGQIPVYLDESYRGTRDFLTALELDGPGVYGGPSL